MVRGLHIETCSLSMQEYLHLECSGWLAIADSWQGSARLFVSPLPVAAVATAHRGQRSPCKATQIIVLARGHQPWSICLLWHRSCLCTKLEQVCSMPNRAYGVVVQRTATLSAGFISDEGSIPTALPLFSRIFFSPLCCGQVSCHGCVRLHNDHPPQGDASTIHLGPTPEWLASKHDRDAVTITYEHHVCIQ